MRGHAALLVLLLALSGCASTLSALGKTPQRVEDAFEDPIRRTHIITKVGLESSTASVAIGCAVLVPFPFSIAVCPVLAVAYNYVAYEFFLEPHAKDEVAAGRPSTTGPYWEGGPQDGEVFTYP